MTPIQFTQQAAGQLPFSQKHLAQAFSAANPPNGGL